MNKIDELEFLLELQELSLGISIHDNIEVYCKDFKRLEKTQRLECPVVINVRKTDWEISGRYIENMLVINKIREDIEKVIVAKFKRIIEDRILEIRKEVRDNLGITEREWGGEKEEQEIRVEEGGSTS